MASYQMRLTDRQRKTGRYVQQAQRELRGAYLEEKKKRGLTLQEIADKLGVEKSVVSRRLSGEANLTLRILVEMAWALGREFSLSLPESLRQEEVASPPSLSKWSQSSELAAALEIRSLVDDTEAERLYADLFSSSREYALNDNWEPLPQLETA
jgi:transcriptional regulator with XRE-family HTH domain